MTKTAVEWLISQLRKPYGDEFIDKIIEQAKEMEKQQKIELGKKVADHWGMTEVPIEEIEKFLNETYGSDEIEKSEKPINLTSSQTEISEHRFTEKEIRFAYMQGYNRGIDGNPNHMESYIEHLKKKQ